MTSDHSELDPIAKASMRHTLYSIALSPRPAKPASSAPSRRRGGAVARDAEGGSGAEGEPGRDAGAVDEEPARLHGGFDDQAPPRFDEAGFQVRRPAPDAVELAGAELETAVGEGHRLATRGADPRRRAHGGRDPQAGAAVVLGSAPPGSRQVQAVAAGRRRLLVGDQDVVERRGQRLAFELDLEAGDRPRLQGSARAIRARIRARLERRAIAV